VRETAAWSVQLFSNCYSAKARWLSGFFIKKKPSQSTLETPHMNWRTALILASSLCQERFYSIRKRSKPAIGQLRSFLRPSFALLRSAFD
jgi:hypothetical protein